MIVRRKCDVPMAKAKGYAGICEPQYCANCPCCIEVDGEGQESHVQTNKNRESLYIPYELRWKASLIEEYGREGFRIDYSID